MDGQHRLSRLWFLCICYRDYPRGENIFSSIKRRGRGIYIYNETEGFSSFKNVRKKCGVFGYNTQNRAVLCFGRGEAVLPLGICWYSILVACQITSSKARVGVLKGERIMFQI